MAILGTDFEGSDLQDVWPMFLWAGVPPSPMASKMERSSMTQDPGSPNLRGAFLVEFGW